MRTDLLLRLADLLEADANNPTGVKFDLNHWGTTAEHAAAYQEYVLPYEEMQAKRFAENTKHIPVDCNTAACAMGLAAISGAFADEGLSWDLCMKRDGTGELLPVMNDRFGFEAASELFGISVSTADHLFNPSHYDVTRGRDAELAVANRVRGLVNGTWTPPADDDDCDDED